MQKFTKIFAVLAQAEMNDELEKALRKVSQMLNLEYEKIVISYQSLSLDYVCCTVDFCAVAQYTWHTMAKYIEAVADRVT